MTKVLFVCHGNICRSPMSDLIEADSIIEDDEMRFLEDLNERFRLINNSIPLL